MGVESICFTSEGLSGRTAQWGREREWEESGGLEGAGDSLSPAGKNMLSNPISCKYMCLCASWGYLSLQYFGKQTFFSLIHSYNFVTTS
jgi:hypothetical protein